MLLPPSLQPPVLRPTVGLIVATSYGAGMLPAELSSPGFRLRPWRQADKASLVANANNRAIWRNMRDIFPHPYTAADAAVWLGYAAERGPEGTYAIEIAGEAVGGVGLTFGKDIERLSAEIGYWLGERYWGRGVMTVAVRAVTRPSGTTCSARRVLRERIAVVEGRGW